MTDIPWRLAGWSAAATILLMPLIAMQFTDEVEWDPSDFVFAGTLILGIGLALELTVRKRSDIWYRAAAGVALAAAFILIWLNAAVGIIGSSADPANAMYGGVLAVGIIGACLARFRPRGMARAMLAMILALMLVTGVALAAGLAEQWRSALQIIILNGFFSALLLVSAWLFRRAASSQ